MSAWDGPPGALCWRSGVSAAGCGAMRGIRDVNSHVDATIAMARPEPASTNRRQPDSSGAVAR
jgi:hypothetical protein